MTSQNGTGPAVAIKLCARCSREFASIFEHQVYCYGCRSKVLAREREQEKVHHYFGKDSVAKAEKVRPFGWLIRDENGKLVWNWELAARYKKEMRFWTELGGVWKGAKK